MPPHPSTHLFAAEQPYRVVSATFSANGIKIPLPIARRTGLFDRAGSSQRSQRRHNEHDGSLPASSPAGRQARLRSMRIRPGGRGKALRPRRARCDLVVFVVKNLDRPKQAPPFAGDPRNYSPIVTKLPRLFRHIAFSRANLSAGETRPLTIRAIPSAGRASDPRSSMAAGCGRAMKPGRRRVRGSSRAGMDPARLLAARLWMEPLLSRPSARSAFRLSRRRDSGIAGEAREGPPAGGASA